MKINVFTAQEVYLPSFDCIFVRNTTCLSDEVIIDTGQIRLLRCEDNHSHSYPFLKDSETEEDTSKSPAAIRKIPGNHPRRRNKDKDKQKDERERKK